MPSRRQFVIFISVIQTFLLLGHFLVYAAFILFFNIPDNQLHLVGAIFLVLSLFFMATSIEAAYVAGPVTKALYRAAAVWLGTYYWLLFVSCLAWVSFFALEFIRSETDISVIVRVLFYLCPVISAYGVWFSYQTKVRNLTVRLNNLPRQWQERKLVLVADTHLGNFRNFGFAQKIAALIENQQPDLVLFAGDMFDGTPDNFQELSAVFAKIKSRFGIFFAAGNHEEFGDKNKFLDPIRKSGIRVLDNELVDIDGLQIIGVDYRDTIKPVEFKKILEKLMIDPNRPSILVKHVPDHIEIAKDAKISLQLSGHTHLAQVYPLRYFTRQIYGKFHYGLNQLDQTQVYTTSGAGTWGPPQRVGTNSEIVVITLRS